MQVLKIQSSEIAQGSISQISKDLKENDYLFIYLC